MFFLKRWWNKLRKPNGKDLVQQYLYRYDMEPMHYAKCPVCHHISTPECLYDECYCHSCGFAKYEKGDVFTQY